MIRYLLERCIRSLLVFLVAIVLIFIIVRIIPSDPVTMMLGSQLTDDSRAILTQEFGLDKSLPTQFILYIENIFTGNFGISFATKRPVWDMLMERLPWTLLLLLCVLICSLIIGITTGLIASQRQNKWSDYVVSAITMLGTSVFAPSLAIVLLYVFGVRLTLLPIGGVQTPGLNASGAAYVRDVAKHLILPTATLSFSASVQYSLYTRSAMIESGKAAYMLTAKSKGMSSARRVLVHGLRNTLIPLSTMTGIWIGNMVGGSVLVETVFAYPGLGRLIYESITRLDYPVLQGAFIIMAFSVVVISLLNDFLYMYLNPQIRFQREKI